jgi:hypothetical protein
MVQTTTSIMWSGRFSLLAGVAAVVAAVVLARTLGAGSSDEEAPAPATAETVAEPSIPAPPRPAPSAPPPAPVPAAPPPAAPVPPVAHPARGLRLVPGSAAVVPETAPDDEKRGKEAFARIEALVRAGDIGLARDLAEDFMRRFPYSRYCPQIETLTGVHPRPAIPGE